MWPNGVSCRVELKDQRYPALSPPEVNTRRSTMINIPTIQGAGSVHIIPAQMFKLGQTAFKGRARG